MKTEKFVNEAATFIFGGIPGLAAKHAPEIGDWFGNKVEAAKEKREERKLEREAKRGA